MKKYISPIILFIVFAVFTLMIAFVDVQAIGPENSSVGFAIINKLVMNAFPYNVFFYKVSSVLGYTAFLTVGIFVVVGIVQLLQKKSLKKVDASLYVLAIVYMLTAILYVVFDKLIVVNYRPVIKDPLEGLEASYPSTHTLIAVVVFGTAFYMISIIMKNEKAILILRWCSVALMLLTVCFRLMSGVHWCTDIIGGILLGCFLISIFLVGLKIFRKSEE